jgi:amidase
LYPEYSRLYPAVFPVTKVDPAVDVKEANYKQQNIIEEHVYEICSLLGTVKLISDDVEDFKGAPVNLQVVGCPYEDEKVLAAMQIIDEIMKS